MPFERSRQIENRLEVIYQLILRGQFSSLQIAEQVGVSVPTISRCVTALRAGGHTYGHEKVRMDGTMFSFWGTVVMETIRRPATILRFLN